jgi:hypothetical protein
VNTDVLVTTNVEPTHKASTSFRRRGGSIFKHINGLGKNKNLAKNPNGARTKNKNAGEPAVVYFYGMISRGPAANYPTD